MGRQDRYPLGAAVTLDALENDLHATTAALRDTEPVSWVPAIGGWLVTRRDLVVDAMHDDESLTVDDPRFTTAQVVGESMLSTDGDRHVHHRAPFVAPFRFGPVKDNFGPGVEDTAARLFESVAPVGSADLRMAVAAPLAVHAVIDALGLVELDIEEVLGWYRSIVASVTGMASGSEPSQVGSAAYDKLRFAVERTVVEAPTSMLADVASNGELDLGEIASNAAVIMFGAIETTEASISNAFVHLLADRPSYEALREDPARVPDAVEESLRLEPSAGQVDRYATTDVRLGTADIAAGDFVALSLSAANRDPEVFARPDQFDISRGNARQHVTFVQGPHACLGIHLARLEMRAALHALIGTLHDVELNDPSLEPKGLVFRKPEHVRATWTV